MGRSRIPGVTLIPELFKVSDSRLTHLSTTYRIYEDRARRKLKFEQNLTGSGKTSLSYTEELYDDTVVYFTTEIFVEDRLNGSRYSCGESPLTPVVLKKDRVSSSGIIITPKLTVSMIKRDNKIVIELSDYIRYDGIGELESTDYIIDDEITGDVIYSRLNDRENLKGIEVVLNNIDENRVYRVRARYRDVLGRYSNYGTAMVTGMSILDLYFPYNELVLEYGRDANIKVSSDEILIDSPMVMKVSVRDVLKEEILYTNGFSVDTTKYAEGDILDCSISYKGYSSSIRLMITSMNLEDRIDDTFKINGSVMNIDVTNAVPGGDITSMEYTDGYIYDVDTSTNMLIRLKFDKNTSKLTNMGGVLTLPTPSNYTQNMIIENPLGGMILISSNASDPTQRVLFISTINEFTITKSVDIPHTAYSATYSGNYYIDKRYLILYNKETPGNVNRLNVYKIDLLTKEIVYVGPVENTNYVLADRLPIKIGDEVLLFNGALDNDKADVLDVLKVNDDNTVGLRSKIPNPIFNLPVGISRVRLITLKNGIPAMFIAPTGGSSMSGIVEIDKKYLSLADKRVATITPAGNHHRKFYKLRDGRFISMSSTPGSTAILFQ